MGPIERRIAREARAMTAAEVIVKAMEKRITWVQAAEILRMTPRNVGRLRAKVEKYGLRELRDKRGDPRRKRVATAKVVATICRLKRETYADFSVQHFYEKAREKHGVKVSYSTTKNILQTAGLVEKSPGRGKHRRRRERRPMVGMLVHMDASTHEWIEELPAWDLFVALDDADGRILFARFVEQEGTEVTLLAMKHILERWGRFCELYTDRGSHFCNTTVAEDGPDEVQNGVVPLALKALGIRQILARSPEARGRSERAFGTIQGRLPQELRVAGVRDYDEANRFLEKHFVPDFNRRFTVKPKEAESAFTPLVGINLRLLLSKQTERVVHNDNTVRFQNLFLQIPAGEERAHYVRCPVMVHEFLDGTLGVSYQGKLLATFRNNGELIVEKKVKRKAA